MTLRQRIEQRIKFWRQMSKNSRPPGPIDTDGKMLLHVLSDKTESLCESFEQALKDDAAYAALKRRRR